VSLITKTKLGLSISPFLVIDDNHHKDMKLNRIELELFVQSIVIIKQDWTNISILVLVVLAPPTYVRP